MSARNKFNVVGARLSGEICPVVSVSVLPLTQKRQNTTVRADSNKQIKKKKITDYLRGYTETDTTRNISLDSLAPTTLSLFRADSLVRYLLQGA
jgi:hypothetical protein